MDIRATIRNSDTDHRVVVSTDGRTSAVTIGGKPGGGSALNGGELLCLALATCYCNDLYREAARRGISVEAVEVEAFAEFGGPGDPARRIEYRARIRSDASDEAVESLLAHTDSVAEVHNTLRAGIPVVRAAGDPSPAT